MPEPTLRYIPGKGWIEPDKKPRKKKKRDKDKHPFWCNCEECKGHSVAIKVK